MKPSLACRVDMSHSATGAYSFHQPCHGRARLGRAALGRFLEKPAQLDLRLQLVLDRGPEADLLPGTRIDPPYTDTRNDPLGSCCMYPLAPLGMAAR